MPRTRRVGSLKNLLVGSLGAADALPRPILRGIDLEARAGERVGVIGRNGAGKTTLMRVIAGIFPPTEGVREVRGTVVPVIAQSVGLDAVLSVRTNIGLGLAYNNRLAELSPELERKILEFAELEDYADQPLAVLSSGMSARLAFSINLFRTPEILVLDEVFATGDAGFRAKAERAMLDQIERSKIVFLVSHNTGTIERVCTRCLLMRRGTIVADGAPADITQEYARSLAA